MDIDIVKDLGKDLIIGISVTLSIVLCIFFVTNILTFWGLPFFVSAFITVIPTMSVLLYLIYEQEKANRCG